ncbi:unnamed protein product, partial [Didymodactylos carnosus]
IVYCSNSILYRHSRQANGCGTIYFNIDNILKIVGYSQMIPCCNLHDLCYDNCTSTKSNCDTQLFKCMLLVCDTLISIQDIVCRSDVSALYLAVVIKGNDAYQAAQKLHCQYRQLNNTNTLY